jgi:hypothetical protein
MSIRSGSIHDLMSWLTLGLAVAAVWRSTVIRLRRPTPVDPLLCQGQCLHCRYDLSGLSLEDRRGTCPECGNALWWPELPPLTYAGVTLLRPRGIAALVIIISPLALPRLINECVDATLVHFNQPILAANARRSIEIGRENQAIIIGGAVCALSVAMLLSWRAPTTQWLSRVSLALAGWIVIYAWNLQPGAWTHGAPWRPAFDRGQAPWIGILMGLASVGIHIALSHAYHALIRWRHARRARPDQPVAQSTEEADA